MSPLKPYLQNNQGYALVTVLLIFTLLMIVVLSFISQSNQTTTQTKVNENILQSIHLAEMGTEFYQNAIINEIYNVTSDVEQELEEFLTANPDQSDQIPILAKEKAIHFIKERLLFDPNRYILENQEKSFSDGLYQFYLDDIQFMEEHNEITYETVGVATEALHRIHSTLVLDFESMEVKMNPSIPGEGPGGIIGIEDEHFPELCGERHLLVGTTCRYDTDVEFTNNNKPKIFRSSIKVNGNLTLPNMNHTDFGRSRFFVMGNFTTQNNFNHTENYFLYVAGKAEIGNINNSKNVIICVNHLAKIGNTNHVENVQIYAKINDTNNPLVFEGEEAFNEGGICSLQLSQGDELLKIIWPSPISIIKHEY